MLSLRYKKNQCLKTYKATKFRLPIQKLELLSVDQIIKTLTFIFAHSLWNQELSLLLTIMWSIIQQIIQKNSFGQFAITSAIITLTGVELFVILHHYSMLEN